MYALGKRWQDGYLDYHRPEACVRIRVGAWWALRRIEGLFFTRPRDWRLVWNYAKEVGLRAVLAKIVSRHKEQLRNEKVLAIGLGTVIETDHPSEARIDQPVVFIAPCHPPCVERIVLPAELTRPVEHSLFDRIVTDKGITFLNEPLEGLKCDKLAGWNRHSGWVLPCDLPDLLDDAADKWQELDVNKTRLLPLAESTPVQERAVSSDRSHPQVGAVLFGLGNYAKTIIVPNLDPRIRIACVHEIDPMQIGTIHSVPWDVDTAPEARSDEHYEVHFIAGYHHTHTPLAVHALDGGAWAVVEKPLVTSWDDLERLTAAVERHPGRLFACFHVRYNRLWRYALEDLGVKSGDPIHYHCLSFEVPLPEKHWYRWPNSQSRVVSNACHWIDHFLFLNNFAQPERYDLWKAGNGDIHISIELANGAVFGMHLTDEGSSRIGLQDHTELRANGVTVKVDNRSRYFAENNRRIVRKCRINKVTAYKDMYRSICEKILSGKPGDDIVSIRSSCEMMLKLEDAYNSA